MSSKWSSEREAGEQRVEQREGGRWAASGVAGGRQVSREWISRNEAGEP